MPSKTVNQLVNRKVPFVVTFLLTILGIIASSFITYIFLYKKREPTPNIAAVQQQGGTSTSNCTENIVTLKGYKLVKPLLYSEKECESDELSSLKGEIGNYIDAQKQAGNITNASVYLKVLSTEEWTSVNPNDSYYPGSLMKLPMLIAFLRMEEAKPGFLNQKVSFNPSAVTNIKQTYETKTIETGHSYTLKELLEYMIAYSDNNATQLLNSYMKMDAINGVFTDIGLTPPPASADYFKYQISARDYSKFMIGIYNSSFLSIPGSEFAAELLAKSDFKDGITKLLPPNVKVAHKFGEAGHGAALELHESGIIFINDKPYQITILTRGTDTKKLSEVLSEVSKIVFDKFHMPSV